MPLRNRYYLSDVTDDVDKTALESRSGSLGWIKPLWILPRAWCVTTSLQAKGVPRHKTSALINLHLGRLAPFADCGVYACRSGDWVHLWFWENERVRVFCEKYSLDFSAINLAPESVCFPKQKNGAVFYRCLKGVEAQLWHHGSLLDSAWWPEMIEAATWEHWRPTAAAVSGARALIASWPETLPEVMAPKHGTHVDAEAVLSEPWAYNLLGKKSWHVLKEVSAEKLVLLAGGVLMLFSCYLLTQWWALQMQQRDVEKQIASLSPLIGPLNDARSRALEDQRWVNKLAGLRSSDDVKSLLASLQPILLGQEAALREFEYLDGEIRLMLVPINTELDLVALTREFEALPNLTDIRLLPESDGRTTRIAAKMHRLGKPGEIKVLGQIQAVDKPLNLTKPAVDRSGKREKGE